MDIKVDISPEQINQAVTDAIIKSTIGENLEAAIKKQLESLSATYNNPIEPVIKEHMHRALSKLIDEHYAEFLKEKIREKLTDEFLSEMFAKMWSAYLNERRY